MKYQRSILELTIPSIVSNITVPLLSVIDTSIVGHMQDANNIGGIYVGSTIFSMIYWVFAFLRMGTTGIVAQARGANDANGVSYGLYRALLIALFISLIMCTLQSPLMSLSLHFLQPPDGVTCYAIQYFRVCIWGAPAMLFSYCLSGWFIGMRDTRTPMMMSITQNVVNVFMSLLFVYVFHSDIRGVAAGTVIGLYTGVVLGVVRLKNKLSYNHKFSVSILLENKEIWRFVKVNRDLFLRTICLVIVTVSFTRFSAQLGEGPLSANAIAMQFFIFYSYFMDGLANAGEAMSGEFMGKQDWLALRHLIRSLFIIGGIISSIFTLFYYLGCSPVIRLMTNDAEVFALTKIVVRHWAWLIPLVSISAFIWDGVFIGLTWSRGMLASTFAALIVFFVSHSIFTESCNSLWFAFLAYLATRGVVQWIIWIRKQPASH